MVSRHDALRMSVILQMVLLQSRFLQKQKINVASPEETKMIELAEKIWRICERKEPFQVKHVEGFKYDIKRRVPDTTKIARMLGWKPQVEFEDGLREVVTWLKKELEKKK